MTAGFGFDAFDRDFGFAFTVIERRVDDATILDAGKALQWLRRRLMDA